MQWKTDGKAEMGICIPGGFKSRSGTLRSDGSSAVERTGYKNMPQKAPQKGEKASGCVCGDVVTESVVVMSMVIPMGLVKQDTPMHSKMERRMNFRRVVATSDSNHTKQLWLEMVVDGAADELSKDAPV